MAQIVPPFLFHLLREQHFKFAVFSVRSLGEGVEWRRRWFFAAFILRLLEAAKTERSDPRNTPTAFCSLLSLGCKKGAPPKREFEITN
ncbi:MAG: hypothetical protein WCL14_13285 [Bacteroidota bacterium]